MPEQQSRRANPVTGAAFEAPFETQIVRYGVNGLDLVDALDALQGWARLTNMDDEQDGELTGRLGQVAIATGGVEHHSMRSFKDVQAGTIPRVWGVDTSLLFGASGALATIDVGYSGDPLGLLPHRPPLSGDPWMFVADRSRMRKVRADGLDLPIGLPAPGAAAGVALATEYRTSIAEFDVTDGTNAATWTRVAGADQSGNPAAQPDVVDITDSPPPGSAIYITTRIGNAQSIYDNWVGHALARNLSLVTPVGGGGPVAASDDDVMHLWLKTTHPQVCEEIRIYLVVSPIFDANELPGLNKLGIGANSDAYVKSFRQNDFVRFIQAQEAQITAAETARIFALRDRDALDRAIADGRASWAEARATADPARARSLQIGTAADQWFEQGSIGLSLRRGDFQRIGNLPGRDWSTVTGLIIYIRVNPTPIVQELAVGIDDFYLTGGWGPDTVEAGAQQYDYRYTNYDPRTGAESNGSPTMSSGNFIDSVRRQITVSPAGFGDAAVRQRFYRRGGSLIDNWYFLGVNGADGGGFTDGLTDDGISAAGTLPIDHFQPVPTIDDAGNTVLAQPVPAIWGPIEGMLLACGDPFRPGHLYFSFPDAPDHWPSDGNVEVCPPSEQLMNGGLMGNQAFVFSRLRLYSLYPNLSGATSITATPSLCKRGLISRWGMVVGPGGIYFVAEDGVFLTTGGPEEWISRDIDPLFKGYVRNGYQPIDKTVVKAIRLTIWEDKLYFLYQDILGARQTLVYSILYKKWRHYQFGRAPAMLQGEDEPDLIIGSLNLGTSYRHDGFSDDGLAIAGRVRTGAFSGNSREEKLFGDQFLDADLGVVGVTLQNFLNEEVVSNLTQAVGPGAGRIRYILDGFGPEPQKAHSISTELTWASATARPTFFQIGYAVTLQPDITVRRVTNWDDLGSSDEVWLTGVTFDCDTGGVPKHIVVERDFGGQRLTVDEFDLNAIGRHKITRSWPAVPARMVRIRPDSDICEFWLLYRLDWISQVEPPRISKWDIHFENQWDQYHTGLDLYCDTSGLEKRIEVFVDEVQLQNALAGLPYWPVIASGRRVVHLTLPWGRGHVYRFRAIDDNPGLLYSHRWHLDLEPTEQANWTQNFSVYNTRADKWLKAVIFECDTFGTNKQVTIEADGVVVETLTVNANGRKVVQLALSVQRLGRVWRLFPIDGNPGRLYSAQPVFDEEPFQLTRWETQETNHNLPGWFTPLFGHIVLKATHPVVLQTTIQHNQPRLGSQPRQTIETYEIPPTGGIKARHFQTFRAGKGVLIKYVLTSPAAFWLYREETTIAIQPWGAPDAIVVQPFGSDDLDPTRPMTQAALAAGSPGGSLGAE